MSWSNDKTKTWEERKPKVPGIFIDTNLVFGECILSEYKKEGRKPDAFTRTSFGLIY